MSDGHFGPDPEPPPAWRRPALPVSLAILSLGAALLRPVLFGAGGIIIPISFALILFGGIWFLIQQRRERRRQAEIKELIDSSRKLLDQLSERREKLGEE